MSPVSAASLASRKHRCGSCQASIFWRLHVGTGNPAPIDEVPNVDGNVVLIGGDHYAVLGKADPRPDDQLRYTNHFATCPKARQHRRP